jgi:indolepyruvate ferredoxin oxidoreductase
VARYLFKLMAYKDEYEVARLHTDPAFTAKIAAHVRRRLQAGAPPGAAAAGEEERQGRAGQAGLRPLDAQRLRLLAKLKGLRGGALDIFGKTENGAWSAS